MQWLGQRRRRQPAKEARHALGPGKRLGGQEGKDAHQQLLKKKKTSLQQILQNSTL